MATPTKNGSRLAFIIVLIPICGVLYYLAPLFLPMWRWQNVDSKWEQIATQNKLSVAKLKQLYDVVVRYKPRGEKDPCPWQVLTCNPAFNPEDEEHHMVRVTFIGDFTGDPPSTLRLGSGNYRDVFFKAKAWRFPPGSFGFNAFRPVMVYDGFSLEKLASSEAYRWDGEMKETNKWTDDDTDVEDGYQVPGANP
jgi:hypothetical protein